MCVESMETCKWVERGGMSQDGRTSGSVRVEIERERRASGGILVELLMPGYGDRVGFCAYYKITYGYEKTQGHR